MKIKPLFPLILFLAGGSPCLAQPEAAPVSRNALFLELLGNGGVYSFNYERMLTESLGLRVGYATWSSLGFWSPSVRYSTVPVTASYLLGRGERKLELGGGITLGRGMLDRNADNRRVTSRTL